MCCSNADCNGDPIVTYDHQNAQHTGDEQVPLPAGSAAYKCEVDTQELKNLGIIS
jgi:hypothetical protein